MRLKNDILATKTVLSVERLRFAMTSARQDTNAARTANTALVLGLQQNPDDAEAAVEAAKAMLVHTGTTVVERIEEIADRARNWSNVQLMARMGSARASSRYR